jgi:hypothetical protein
MARDDNLIPVENNDQIDALHQIAKEANALYDTVQSIYNETQKEYLNGHLEYSYRVIQTIGLLAGFGFTAVSRIETIGLFIVGELLLIVAIIFGLYKTRNLYTSTIDKLDVEGNKKKKVVWERNKYCMDVLRQATNDKQIPADFQKKLDELNSTMVSEFAPKDMHEDKPNFKDHLIPMILIGFVGVAFILASFLKFHLNCWF